MNFLPEVLIFPIMTEQYFMMILNAQVFLAVI